MVLTEYLNTEENTSLPSVILELPITTTGNVTHSRNEDLARIEIVVQAVIFALAIFGNALVLIMLGRRRQKPNRMHILIMHLSIADLLVAFFNILPQLIWDITHIWHGGDALCRIVKYAQIFVMYLSTYILVMTAIDRYRAVCHPLSNHTWTPRLVHIMVGIAYLLSGLFSLPQAIIFGYKDTGHVSGAMDCWVDFNPKWTLHLYIISFTVLVYVIPLLILIGCYGLICTTIWRKFKESNTPDIVRAEGAESQESCHCSKTKYTKVSLNDCRTQPVNVSVVPRNHSIRGLTKAKLKTIKLTFAIILAYIVCWSPFFISQLWWLHDESAPHMNNVLVIGLLLASLNSCCNPWIYLAFSGNFIKNMTPCSCETFSSAGVGKHCLCSYSKKRSLGNTQHKRKWTFRSADSFTMVPVTSTNLTSVKKDLLLEQNKEDTILLNDIYETKEYMNGKNEIHETA